MPARSGSSTIKAMLTRICSPLLVLWLAFGLRLVRLDFQSLWWDEGHSIFVAAHPISQIPTLPAMDVHPPLYFVLLHGWLIIAGRSEFALRYLSVVFSLLTVALLWRFAASLAHRTGQTFAPALVTSLLAALSPFYVAYAQEVRSYALITCLALASTYALWQILFRPPAAGARRPAVVIYVISTAACLYTHYFTIFLLLFQNLAWLVWVVGGQWSVVSGQSKAVGGQRSAVKQLALWSGVQAAVLLLFTPQLWLALRQVTGYTNPNLSPPPLIDFISRSWQAYTVGLTLDPTPARWGMVFLLVVLLTAWLSLLIQLRNFSTQNFKLETQNFLFLTAWFVLPLAAYFIVLQRQPSFEPRYMMLVTPALFLLLGLGSGQAASGQWQVAGSKVAGNRVAGSKVAGSRVAGSRVASSRVASNKWQVAGIPKSPAPRSPLSAFRSPLSALRPSLLALRLTLPAITLIVFVVSLHSYYTNDAYFKDDSAGVAGWLANETGANDLVYIDVPHPFHYYAGRIPAPTRYLFVDI
ncbi:MAG: glycosyltransferase family 39 protein, partial [Chloroflexota bacterium]